MNLKKTLKGINIVNVQINLRKHFLFKIKRNRWSILPELVHKPQHLQEGRVNVEDDTSDVVDSSIGSGISKCPISSSWELTAVKVFKVLLLG